MRQSALDLDREDGPYDEVRLPMHTQDSVPADRFDLLPKRTRRPAGGVFFSIEQLLAALRRHVLACASGVTADPLDRVFSSGL